MAATFARGKRRYRRRQPLVGGFPLIPSSAPRGLPSVSVPPKPSIATSDDLAGRAGQELANAVLLARCGSDLDASASNGVASLTITEMTAADVERTQAEVETAFHSEDMGSGDDDDLTDEQHASSALA